MPVDTTVSPPGFNPWSHPRLWPLTDHATALWFSCHRSCYRPARLPPPSPSRSLLATWVLRLVSQLLSSSGFGSFRRGWTLFGKDTCLMLELWSFAKLSVVNWKGWWILLSYYSDYAHCFGLYLVWSWLYFSWQLICCLWWTAESRQTCCYRALVSWAANVQLMAVSIRCEMRVHLVWSITIDITKRQWRR